MGKTALINQFIKNKDAIFFTGIESNERQNLENFSRSCFKHFSDIDMAAIYGMVGGTPQYLLQMDDGLTLEENIKRCFLDPTSPLFEEPNNLLKQEVREPAIYNAIITVIARGSTRLSEISTKVGEETSSCSAYIKNLISLGIVKKEMPITENTTRKTIYKIDDNLFRFWYSFVPDNLVPCKA